MSTTYSICRCNLEAGRMFARGRMAILAFVLLSGVTAPAHAIDINDFRSAVRAIKEELNRKVHQPATPDSPASDAAPQTAAQLWGRFPERDITLVAPKSSAGIARSFAAKFGTVLRTNVSVSEPSARSGGPASGQIVARAAADGHTLLFEDIGVAFPFAADGVLRGHARDLIYLGLVAEEPIVLIGRPGVPASNFDDLRQWIGAHPGQVRFVVEEHRSSLSRLCARLLAAEMQVQITMVTVQSNGSATGELTGKGADLACGPALRWMPMIESGGVRAFAVGARTRATTPAIARLPTFEQLGMLGMPVGNWYGLYAPSGTPAGTVEAIGTALTQAVRDGAWAEAQWPGLAIVDDDRNQPAAHRRFVEEQVAKWSKGLDPATAPGTGPVQLPPVSSAQAAGACGGATVGPPAPAAGPVADVTAIQPIERAVSDPANPRGIPRNSSFRYLQTRFAQPALQKLFERAAEQPLDPLYYVRQNYQPKSPAYDKYRAEIESLSPPDRAALLGALIVHARFFRYGPHALLEVFPEAKSYVYVWGRPAKLPIGAWEQYGRARDKPPGALCHGDLKQFVMSPVQSRESDFPDGGGEWLFQAYLEGTDERSAAMLIR